eukprot:m.1160421 g.1160421  ORF g.1160421 m.1160421 type:complete len:62 (+) comp24501_c0_seq78:3879-4064(+)
MNAFAFMHIRSLPTGNDDSEAAATVCKRISRHRSMQELQRRAFTHATHRRVEMSATWRRRG